MLVNQFQDEADTVNISPGFPVSLLLIGTIYTSTKALQFLSIPVYTIFKNLTIILIAYGEVLWFGGSVTGMALFSFGLMVLSSVIAAWADIQHALQNYGHSETEASAKVSTLNAGYMWMMFNCICSAAYVLGMRKRIKLTNFKDFDSEFLPVVLQSISTDLMPSHVLQQCPFNSHPARLFPPPRELVVSKHRDQLPTYAEKPHHLGHDLLRPVIRLYLLHLRLVRPRHLLYNIFNGRRPEQVTDCSKRTDILRCSHHARQCLRHWRRLRQRNRLRIGQSQAVIRTKDWDPPNDISTHERQQPKRQRLVQIMISPQTLSPRAIPPR